MASEAPVDLVAIFYPKADKADELRAEMVELSKKVQENEPTTLIYYFLDLPEKNEIVVVERYKNQAAMQSHIETPYFQEFAAKAPSLCEKPFEVKMGGRFTGFERVARI